MKDPLTSKLSLLALSLLALVACGQPEEEGADVVSSTESAIVGGTVAKSGGWAGTAALYSGRSQVCGGSLVAPGWVVTAAHCIRPSLSNGGISRVVVGRTTLSSTGGEVLTVRRAIRHPGYSSATSDNDIALLQLWSSATTPVVKIASSSAFAQLAPTATVTVVGWGLTSESGFNTSNVLRQVDVPLIPTAQCQQFPDYETVTANMLCAGLPQGGKDSCQGDSGGPLYATIGGAVYQAGVVSWGMGCARPNAPGVYTKISNYAAWLSSASGGAVTVSDPAGI